ncbi:MAG: gluconokinase [Alphaproteobacteria bacterium]|nr:gluconokinase [Alphaproteobacteria bacterium]
MPVHVVMGVSGCGKSTVGMLIAGKLRARYAEGDSFHPPENVAKMRGGQPLDDDDRAPWLSAMAQAIRDWNAKGETVVLACSALKRRYRDVLRGGGDVRFIHLAGDKAAIAARLAARTGHYMPTTLLDSQFATLEPPGDDEAITVSIEGAPAEIAQRAIDALSSRA